MDELLKKAQIDIPRLHRFIKMTAAFELSKLSEPCYFPPLKRTYFELLRQIHISDNDMKAFVKRMYKGTRAQSWNLWRSPDHNLMMFIMHIFLKNNNKDAYDAAMIYYMIRQYSHLIQKHMKYCNVEAFKYALETLTKTHLFSREKTIGNSLLHLAREVEKTFTKDIASWNIDRLIDFIAASRHRISQSVKSFSHHYYEAQRGGQGIRTQIEPSENDEFMVQVVTMEKGKRVIEETIKKITMYKTVDRKALEESKNITKIKTSIADMIVKSIMNLKYSDLIRTILQLFVKDITSTSAVCGKEYYAYVKRLMAVKRSKSKIFFKQQVGILIREVLKENGVLETYESYTPQTQFIINSFLAFYLTMTLRDIIC